MNCLYTILVTCFCVVLTLVSCNPAHAQIVDQQSYPPDISQAGFGISLDSAVGPNNRIAQTFIPSFDSLDFFSFFLRDGREDNGIGHTVLVEIMNSDLSAVIGTSEPVMLPDNFGSSHLFQGEEVFFCFDSPVPLCPGTTYAARLRKIDGDLFRVYGGKYNGYPSGKYYAASSYRDDFFFREGLLYVPEPSTLSMIALLLLIGIIHTRRR